MNIMKIIVRGYELHRQFLYPKEDRILFSQRDALILYMFLAVDIRNSICRLNYHIIMNFGRPDEPLGGPFWPL